MEYIQTTVKQIVNHFSLLEAFWVYGASFILIKTNDPSKGAVETSYWSPFLPMTFSGTQYRVDRNPPRLGKELMATDCKRARHYATAAPLYW